ncbi:MAG: cyclic nucleotide-binding domain-containing protein [Geminicoccaceae bacterium]
MPDMLFTYSAAWVHLASTLYVMGFWVRDQLVLRCLVLLGTIFYIIYYYYAAEFPLWSAIGWSTILGIVNLYVTLQLAMERTTFRMSRHERQLYGAFASMTPGEFRKLLDKAIWREARQRTLLTEENKPNKSLFYIVDGSVTVQKKDRSFARTNGSFVGEVSYLLHSNATATAHAGENTRYIEWRHDDLAEIERRHTNIKVALREILNTDLASKVAEGTAGRRPSETVDNLVCEAR